MFRHEENNIVGDTSTARFNASSSVNVQSAMRIEPINGRVFVTTNEGSNPPYEPLQRAGTTIDDIHYQELGPPYGNIRQSLDYEPVPD